MDNYIFDYLRHVFEQGMRELDAKYHSGGITQSDYISEKQQAEQNFQDAMTEHYSGMEVDRDPNYCNGLRR